MVVCSATNVESCLCLKARKVWQRGRLEAGSDFKEGDARCSVRVFERYSMMGGNRLSLTLTIPMHKCSFTGISARSAFNQSCFFGKSFWGTSAAGTALCPASIWLGRGRSSTICTMTVGWMCWAAHRSCYHAFQRTSRSCAQRADNPGS